MVPVRERPFCRSPRFVAKICFTFWRLCLVVVSFSSAVCSRVLGKSPPHHREGPLVAPRAYREKDFDVRPTLGSGSPPLARAQTSARGPRASRRRRGRGCGSQAPRARAVD